MESSRDQEKMHQRSWTWLCLTALKLTAVILTTVFMLVVVTSMLRNKEYEAVLSSRRVLSEVSTKSMESTCNITLYKDLCYQTLLPVDSTEPEVLFRASLVKAMDEHVKIPWKLISSDEFIDSRLNLSKEMIIDSLEYLNETINIFDVFGKALGEAEIDEIREKLTRVIVDHATCTENFEEIEEFDSSSYQSNVEAIKNMRDSLQKGKELVSNSLAIVTKILGGSQWRRKQVDTSLLGAEETNFPRWFPSDDQDNLLNCHLIPNITVASDGTGDYRTITEAVVSIPKKSTSRFVIHVKGGLYTENVVVPNDKQNVVMYGDGNMKTIVSGNRNRVDDPNLKTLQTATFAVYGEGFVVRDIQFENTAGPGKNQAVAFYSRSSYSVMYRCTFLGFQDTLYPHSGDQFYRECNIIGTIDFIFGAASAVFQNCDILPRQPLQKQYDTITAQSAERDTKSGFSIISSRILPYSGERLTAPVYLGRPWRNYATVVVMKSLLGEIIDPKGWVAWNQTLDPPPPTVTYGEYRNYGPGADVTNRVNWLSYKPNMTDQEGRKYTVDVLINQNDWLRKTCVPYNGSL